MTFSFQLLNGDLNPQGPSGLAQVTGSQKLIQDLRCWYLTAIGSNPLHLDYGSSLDGGPGTDGTPIMSLLGNVIDANLILQVEAEIRRVLAAYQQQQVQRLLQDQQNLSGKNTFSQGELLQQVDSVNVSQVGDVLVANVQITTMDGTTIATALPVTTTSS